MGAKLIWRQYLAIIAAKNSKGIKLKFTGFTLKL